jgi:hypothetical protein
VESEQKKPVFEIYRLVGAWITALIITSIPIIAILVARPPYFSIQFLAMVCLALALGLFTIFHKEYLFFGNYLQIKGIISKPKSMTYADLILVLPKYPKFIDRFGVNIILLPKQEGITKPIEIKANPYNKKIGMDLRTWLKTKIISRDDA